MLSDAEALAPIYLYRFRIYLFVAILLVAAIAFDMSF